MFFSPKVRRAVAALSIALLLLQIGCRTWVEHPVPRDSAPISAISGVVRVTMTQGKAMTLRNTVVARDSILGLLASTSVYRIAIPLGDVTKIEQRVDTLPQWA